MPQNENPIGGETCGYLFQHPGAVVFCQVDKQIAAEDDVIGCVGLDGRPVQQVASAEADATPDTLAQLVLAVLGLCKFSAAKRQRQAFKRSRSIQPSAGTVQPLPAQIECIDPRLLSSDPKLRAE